MLDNNIRTSRPRLYTIILCKNRNKGYTQAVLTKFSVTTNTRFLGLCKSVHTEMSILTVLRKYALKDPESLPSSILFKHSSNNITIFDAYPKSIFHFLILPRIQNPDPVLSNLGTLLNCGDKVRAKEVITSLWEDAQVLKKEIWDEMISRYGFKWDIWIGFHGAPSMEYVISSSHPKSTT